MLKDLQDRGLIHLRHRRRVSKSTSTALQDNRGLLQRNKQKHLHIELQL